MLPNPTYPQSPTVSGSKKSPIIKTKAFKQSVRTRFWVLLLTLSFLVLFRDLLSYLKALLLLLALSNFFRIIHYVGDHIAMFYSRESLTILFHPKRKSYPYTFLKFIHCPVLSVQQVFDQLFCALIQQRPFCIIRDLKIRKVSWINLILGGENSHLLHLWNFQRRSASFNTSLN